MKPLASARHIAHLECISGDRDLWAKEPAWSIFRAAWHLMVPMERATIARGELERTLRDFQPSR